MYGIICVSGIVCGLLFVFSLPIFECVMHKKMTKDIQELKEKIEKQDVR